MVTQTDLHYRPEILRRYGTAVIVGHDEYWTAEMRRTVDVFVEAGGRMARFAGNFLWQVRLEDEGRRPVRDTARAHAEDRWEERRVGNRGAGTVRKWCSP